MSQEYLKANMPSLHWRAKKKKERIHNNIHVFILIPLLVAGLLQIMNYGLPVVK